MPPADFLPELPDWRIRSPFLFREGLIAFFHDDLYSQALAKLERGLAHDLSDVRAMVDSGAVDLALLSELFSAITLELYRFPAVEPEILGAAVHELIRESGGTDD